MYQWSAGDELTAARLKASGVAYAADAEASDAYVISTGVSIAAYVAGMCFQFKANTSNTGAATLAVDGLAAKTIKKYGTSGITDLADNDIQSGQIVTVVYDGTYMQLQSGVPSGTPTFTLVAGEDIAIRDAVAVAASAVTLRTLTVTGADDTNRTVGSNADGQYKVAQRIAGDGNTYNTLTFYITKSGSPSQNLTVSIQADSGGNPSGTALASVTVAPGDITNGTDNTFTLNVPVTLANATDYHLVASVDSLSASYYIFRSNSGNPYASGEFSSYNGSSWSDTAGHDLRCSAKFNTVAGRAYKADSDVASLATGFCGFAYAAASAAANVTLQYSDVMSGFAGLTIGSTYYVNATPGAIGTSAGSTSKKVGIAISATQLLILPTL